MKKNVLHLIGTILFVGCAVFISGHNVLASTSIYGSWITNTYGDYQNDHYSKTWALTTTVSATNSYLVCNFSQNGYTSTNLTGITWNGVAMSNQSTGAANNPRLSVWTLANPANGSHNLVVSYDAAHIAYSLSCFQINDTLSLAQNVHISSNPYTITDIYSNSLDVIINQATTGAATSTTNASLWATGAASSFYQSVFYGAGSTNGVSHTASPNFNQAIALEFRGITYPVVIGTPANYTVLTPDTYTTVSGSCSTNGHYLAITETPASVHSSSFTCGCIGNAFSCSYFYTNQSSGKIYVVEDDSTTWSGGVFIPETNPDDKVDWATLGTAGGGLITNQNEQFFSDIYSGGYDITIKKPVDQSQFPAFVFPVGSTPTTNREFDFQLDKPTSVASSTVWFNIKRYLDDGSFVDQLTNSVLSSTGYGSGNLLVVNLISATSTPYNYILQLSNASSSPIIFYRRYSIRLTESDLATDVNYSASSTVGILGTLTDVLKRKVLFNYLFLSYGALNDFFNQNQTSVSANSVDLNFYMPSTTAGSYTTVMPVLSFSNPIVLAFLNLLRPIITAIIWILFAVFSVWRITHLYNQS